ncbi:MAG: sulfurtransferase TusA family protein [Rhodospirillaceae bacterium]
MGSSVPVLHFIDITGQVCPMTFVKVRLALEIIGLDDILTIRVRPGEALENLSPSLAEIGFRVILVAPEIPDMPDGVHLVTVARR